MHNFIHELKFAYPLHCPCCFKVENVKVAEKPVSDNSGITGLDGTSVQITVPVELSIAYRGGKKREQRRGSSKIIHMSGEWDNPGMTTNQKGGLEVEWRGPESNGRFQDYI